MGSITCCRALKTINLHRWQGYLHRFWKGLLPWWRRRHCRRFLVCCCIQRWLRQQRVRSISQSSPSAWLRSPSACHKPTSNMKFHEVSVTFISQTWPWMHITSNIALLSVMHSTVSHGILIGHWISSTVTNSIMEIIPYLLERPRNERKFYKRLLQIWFFSKCVLLLPCPLDNMSYQFDLIDIPIFHNWPKTVQKGKALVHPN